jgi:hypothetical protein
MCVCCAPAAGCRSPLLYYFRHNIEAEDADKDPRRKAHYGVVFILEFNRE